jgi:RNA polymerase sigma-70 factor (ECF subfamily)
MASIELVEKIASVERSEAFRRLAERHLTSAYGLARAILHDPAEAEDATHDAFVTAWRKWDTLRDITRFEAWFDRILVNTCRNHMRGSGRRLLREVRDVSFEFLPVAGDAMRGAEDRDALSHALRTLTPDQRVVVALRYYRDLSVDEIAERVGIPSGTVKSRLHYALSALHDALGTAGDTGVANERI